MKMMQQFLTTTKQKIISWARSESLWPLSFGEPCCHLETINAQFNIPSFMTSPRQSDLLIISGAITQKMEQHILTIYEQMLFPKHVLAIGSCAISAGLFKKSYAILKKASDILPVDLEIPGCPPSRHEIASGILNLQQKIKNQEI